MKNILYPKSKIKTLAELLHLIEAWHLKGKTVAFTNGCFDILHKGHIASLSQAAAAADILIVGLNSDSSVNRLKGNDRPINNQNDRAELLASLLIVDAITIFEEDTPLELIKALEPDVLVKGGDYTLEQIVGAAEVQAYGGQVIINPIVQGYSSTALIEKAKKLS